MTRITPVPLILLLLVGVMLTAGCGKKEVEVQGAPTLTFPDLVEQRGEERSVSPRAEAMNGQLVTIEGWMSPLSPFRANYFYLISVPSDSCPFCADGEVDYFDVVVVYLPEAETFSYTLLPLRVFGILEVGHAAEDEHLQSYFRLQVEDVSDILHMGIK